MRQFTLLKITCLFSVSSVTGTGFQEHNNYYKYLRTARRSSLEPREYNKVVQMILFVILFNKPLSSDISYIPVSSSSQSSSSAGSQVEGRNFILQKLCELGLGEVNMNFVKFQFVIATIKHVTVIEPKLLPSLLGWRHHYSVLCEYSTRWSDLSSVSSECQVKKLQR